MEIYIEKAGQLLHMKIIFLWGGGWFSSAIPPTPTKFIAVLGGRDLTSQKAVFLCLFLHNQKGNGVIFPIILLLWYI